MIRDIDPRFETLFLLMAAAQGEDWQGEVFAALDGLGMDGPAFYKRHFPVVDRYYAAFLKHKVDSPGAGLLGEAEEAMLAVYSDIFWRHPAWLDGMEGVPDEEAAFAVHTEFREEGMELIDAVEALGLPDRAKWQAMVLTQKPKRQLALVAAAVRDNLPAFGKARARVAPELVALLDGFAAGQEKPGQARLMQLSHSVTPGAPILPTLALPLAVLVTEEVTFYGLLSDLVAGTGTEATRAELQMGARALSEKSKVALLLCLKDESLYNLELAERVGLTAATVSHHMNVLLTAGFVELDKRDGKVYYSLSKDGIQRFLQGIEQLFL